MRRFRLLVQERAWVVELDGEGRRGGCKKGERKEAVGRDDGGCERVRRLSRSDESNDY